MWWYDCMKNSLHPVASSKVQLMIHRVWYCSVFRKGFVRQPHPINLFSRMQLLRSQFQSTKSSAELLKTKNVIRLTVNSNRQCMKWCLRWKSCIYFQWLRRSILKMRQQIWYNRWQLPIMERRTCFHLQNLIKIEMKLLITNLLIVLFTKETTVIINSRVD